MKMSPAIRTTLRKIIRDHQNVCNFISKKSDVNNLSRDELVELGDNLNINLIKAVEEMMDVKWGDWSLAFRDHESALEGVFEFDLNLSAFGTSETNKVRITFEFCPEWQYFCPKDKRLKYRWAGSTMRFEIEVIDFEKVDDNGKVIEKGRNWVLLDDKILDGNIFNKIDFKLEMHLWEQDQINRKKNGFPPGDKSQATFLFS
jgi:hypothetical protein